MPLVHCKNTDYAAFFGAQSAQKAKKYDTDSANANARLSTQLPYIFAMSRFAHYLKSMMRDKIGSFMSRKDCEMFLNQWIQNYVTPDDTASAETKARYPLREARIEVAELPGKPGCYKAIAFLRPHFQLDELTVSLRLVAELPQSVRK
jgi:type VI secretion system protein ImpC